MPNYGDPSYWDDRYAKSSDSMFDWLESYDQLKGLLEKFCKKTDRFLILGCGNANFSEDFYDAGYKNQVNIDISSVVIEQMSKRNRSRKKMVYEVMDVLDLKYPDNSFDVIIDKSTIDAILCGDNAFLNTAIMLKEAQRVLKVDGAYIAISYGKPESRAFHFTRSFLSWEMKQFNLFPVEYEDEKDKEERSHYIYVCIKQPDWKEINAANFEASIIKLILHEKQTHHPSKLDESDDDAEVNVLSPKVSEDIKKAKK